MTNTKKTDNNQQSLNHLIGAKGYFGLLFLFGACTFCLYRQYKEDQAAYIIRHKTEQKISYAPVENQSDLHVMEFGAFDTDSLLYKNLKVGDTIFGCKSMLDKTIVPASRKHKGPYIWNPYTFSVTREYAIYRVNGEPLVQIRRKAESALEQARRDSVLRQMKQR